MLSKDSLLFALNSGCLNSHAYIVQPGRVGAAEVSTYPGAVRRLSVLFITVPNLVEVVLVQLADEACKIAMLEVLRKNGLGESFILSAESDGANIPTLLF